MSSFDGPGEPQGPDRAAGSGDDLTAKIERLAGLHSAGHLTDTEFAQAKAKLLAEEPEPARWSPTPPPRAAAGQGPASGAGSGSAPASSTAQSQSSGLPGARPDASASRPAPPTSWPGQPAAGPMPPLGAEPPAPGTAPELQGSPTSRKRAIVLLIVAVVVVVGGAIAYSVVHDRKAQETVHGTFTIENGRYDPSNEYDEPNITADIDGCEGDNGYGDLNATTQVVVKDNHGNEVARTELGEGDDGFNPLTGNCKFTFEFEVTKGPKYFVVSVGRRGESKYTYEQLSRPGAIELTIGS